MQERLFVGELDCREYYELAAAIHGKLNDRPFADAGEGRWLCVLITWTPRESLVFLPRGEFVGDVEVTLHRLDHQQHVGHWIDIDGTPRSIDLIEYPRADFATHLAKLRDTASDQERFSLACLWVLEELRAFVLYGVRLLWRLFFRRRLQLRRDKGAT